MQAYMASFSPIDDRFPLARACHTSDISSALFNPKHRAPTLATRATRRTPSLPRPVARKPRVDLDVQHSSQPHIRIAASKPAPHDLAHTDIDSAYPSPPPTGSASRSTVPLPAISGEPFPGFHVVPIPLESVVWDMSHEDMPAREPLSPPLTFLVGTHELPRTDFGACSKHANSYSGPRSGFGHRDGQDAVADDMHRDSRWTTDPSDVEMDATDGMSSMSPADSWSFDGSLAELAALNGHAGPSATHATLPTPLRGDSGFEETGQLHKGESGFYPDCSIFGPHGWTLDSPVSMDITLPDAVYTSTGSSVHVQGTLDQLSPISSSSSSEESHSPHSWSSMDWSSASGGFSPSASSLLSAGDHLEHPSGCRNNRLQLDMQEWGSSSMWRSSYEPQASGSHCAHDQMDVEDDEPSPASPRAMELRLPPPNDVDVSFADTIMPLEDDDYTAGGSHYHPFVPPIYPSYSTFDSPEYSATYHDELYPTPIPSSPRSPSALLPELDDDDDDYDVPPSPSSRNQSLPDLPDAEYDPYANPDAESGTISPLLLGGPALGLCLQPVSVDPPIARSPSPDDDALHFLEPQLDPNTSKLDPYEFRALRDLRRRASSAERAAQEAEATLGERVSHTAHELLPPAHGEPGVMQDELDLAEKRVRKRELHCAMELRAEARQRRKREKQRGKEVGALLALKMPDDVVIPGSGSMRSIAQLVANMVLRRRDVFRPLANRKALPRTYVKSSLQHSISAEDLLDVMDED